MLGLMSLDGEADTHSFHYPSARLFWCVGFIFASFLAVLFQKVVLSLVPDMHAGHGLLQNDAIGFHNIAVGAAERIRANGWSEWRLFPGAAGNVGMLSAVYVLFGPDPVWFIPITAAAHATGALLIYRMGGWLCLGKAGMLGGLMAGIAFLAFPSALQWYGQNHKDAFAIAGILLVLDSWLELHSREDVRLRALFSLVVRAVLGAALVGVVRPYFPIPLVCALVVSSAVVTVFSVMSCPRVALPALARQLVLVGSVLLVALTFARMDVDMGVGAHLLSDSARVHLDITLDSENGQSWHWEPTTMVPAEVDKVLKRASELRVHFVVFGRSVFAGSEIDGERLPNSVLSVLLYMPRAFVVGLFAPFPDTWGERVSVPRLVGAAETMVWYVFALGFVVTVWRMSSRPLLAGVTFCATVLVMLAYLHPNVGTLYRQRFGVWQFFLLCGSVGWASLILAMLEQRTVVRKREGRGPLSTDGVALAGAVSSNVDRLAASSAVVIMITVLCHLGFLTRDLLLVKQLGVNEGLDAFFTAMMVPMFFVTFLAMPMADALTLPFLSISGDESGVRRELLIRHMLGFAILLLGAVAVLVAIAAPQIVSVVLGNGGSDKAGQAATMLRWFAPIILLSAWTVVGNAALNALGRSRLAVLGHLVVPIVTIVALVAASPSNASVAAIGGMLLGTAFNLVWVVFCLRSCGIRLVPAFPAALVVRAVTPSYWRLIGVALLTAALVPMNYAFAASVVSGAVSAWALASKIVVLFSGLASVGASFVVLPYLAHQMSHGAKKEMQDDAYFLLLVGGWIGGLLTVGTMLFAEPLVGAALSGSLSQAQVVELTNIVKVYVLQLPVAVTGVLITKMAIVSGISSRVLVAALLGFACNLAVNVAFVTPMGVLGVAIGALCASVVTTLSLAVAANRRIGLSFRQLLIVFASWLVWGGVCVAIDSHDMTAMECAALTVFAMVWVQFTHCLAGRKLLICEAKV